MSKTRVPAIPAPTDANLREVARAIKAVLDVREGLLGDPLDTNVTFRDLQTAGVIQTTVVGGSGGSGGSGGLIVSPGAGGGTSSGYDPSKDFNPPPAPTNLQAAGALTSVILTWDSIPVSYPNHAYTEVWRADENVIGNAVMVGTTNATVYADSVGQTGTTFYYWIRYRSQADVTGPYNATEGVVAGTGRIGNLDLGPLIVAAGNLAAGAVSLEKFGEDLEPVTVVSSVPSTKATSSIFNTTDGKLYRWDGTAYVATVPTTDLTGTVSDAQIAGLAASKVTGQLSDSQLAAISAAKVSGQLTDAQIADIAATKVTGQLTDAQIADVDAAKVTGQITETQIADDAISTPKLAAGAITTAKLAAGAVTANEIASNAITAEKIEAGAVTTAKLAAGAVTAEEIAAGAITTPKLAAGAVTANELAADSVTADKVAANAITAGKIEAGAITTAKLAAGAVTASEIAAGAVTAGKIAADAVTANELAANAVTAGKIEAGAVGANQIAANAIAVGTAAIENGAIVNAMIGALAVDDAKIADLSVAKLTGAEMKVGSFIQSTGFTTGASGFGWRIDADGAAEFNNVVVRGQVIGSAITGGTVDGAIITGATLRTAVSGQRIELDANGLLFLTGATSGKYGQFKYGEKKYGTGVLVYFNNATKRVPFYVGAEQNVADIHLYNRGSNPTGGTYEAGDMIVVNGRLRIYVPALGGWKQVALEP